MTKIQNAHNSESPEKTPLPHKDGCDCIHCLTYGYSDQWDEFDHAYIDFAIEYSRQMLAYTLGIEFLSDFPKNLPQDILIPIVAKRHQVLSAETRRRGIPPVPEYAVDDAFFKFVSSVELTEEQHRIRCAYEGLYHVARYGKKMAEMEFPQFDRFLVAQNVVVICAFAEGFLANTIRTLCVANPTPFDRWKKERDSKFTDLTKSDVLEQFIFELGYGSFEKKLNRIEQRFSFRIPTPKSDREKICELFLIRNCLVHNAGLVSQAYKQWGMARSTLSVGDEIPLPADATEELLDTLVDTVAVIYRSVSVNVLKKSPDRLMFGPHRNPSKDCFEPSKEEQ